MIQSDGKENYPEEFKRDAVALCRDTETTRHRAGEAGHRARPPAVGGQIFRRGDELVSRFQFVADHRDAFEVKWLSEVVDITRSSFCAWLAAADHRAAKAAADESLEVRIRAVHAEDNTDGASRITAELHDGTPTGERVNH